MSQSVEYHVSTAVSRRFVRDMAIEDRPQRRAFSVGFGNLSTAELMALLLPAPDALDMARDLLDTFGGVWKLHEAEINELTQIAGVGEARARMIKAAIELGRRAMVGPLEERPRVDSPAAAANLLMPEMITLKREELRVILLDTRNRVMGVRTIYQGSLNTAVARISEIYRPAIVNDAAAIILAHNHPSGTPDPSPEDVNITREVAQAGDMLSIALLDHIIIGWHRFVSLKERGLL